MDRHLAESIVLVANWGMPMGEKQRTPKETPRRPRRRVAVFRQRKFALFNERTALVAMHRIAYLITASAVSLLCMAVLNTILWIFPHSGPTFLSSRLPSYDDQEFFFGLD